MDLRQSTKTQIRLCGCTDRSGSSLCAHVRMYILEKENPTHIKLADHSSVPFEGHQTLLDHCSILYDGQSNAMQRTF